jgi:hypothetical protein
MLSNFFLFSPTWWKHFIKSLYIKDYGKAGFTQILINGRPIDYNAHYKSVIFLDDPFEVVPLSEIKLQSVEAMEMLKKALNVAKIEYKGSPTLKD